MSTVLWFAGFALMMGSFSFLFGRSETRSRPRISVDTLPHTSHHHHHRHAHRRGRHSEA